MKLLFDENLSPGLDGGLSDVFPGFLQVRHVGLSRASDTAIWNYAREHGLSIASDNSDFHRVSFLRGPPPRGGLRHVAVTSLTFPTQDIWFFSKTCGRGPELRLRQIVRSAHREGPLGSRVALRKRPARAVAEAPAEAALEASFPHKPTRLVPGGT